MSDQQQKTPTTIARFYKCALQVNSARYLKYRGQEQTLSDEEYNWLLLAYAIDAGVEVIGLADHGSVEGSDQLRKLLWAMSGKCS
ncbi:MAG: hypothetical protein ACR2PT_12925 [Endozoicomonas sp.]